MTSELFSCDTSQALLAGLSDSQFSGTGFHSAGLSYEDSRLNGASAWSSQGLHSNHYIQADLGETKVIVKFATQGRAAGGNNPVQYVSSYMFGYSIDDVTYYIVQEDYSDRVFTGNTDSDTIVEHTFDNVIVARYVRVYPQTWEHHISMRWEVYECQSTGKHTVKWTQFWGAVLLEHTCRHRLVSSRCDVSVLLLLRTGASQVGSSCFWDDDCETENAQCKAVDPVVQSLFTPMACVCKTGYTAVGTDFCKPSESSRLFL